MPGTILMLLLLVAGSSALADWTEVSQNNTGILYADTGTIRKEGDVARMWDLLDFKVAQSRPYGTPYLSQKTQRQYDCKGGRARTIEVFRYAENKAAGESNSTDDGPGEWEPVAGSTSEALWMRACGQTR